MKKSLAIFLAILVIAVSCVFALSACSTSVNGYDIDIELVDESLTYTGNPIQYTIKCTDADGNEVTGYSVEWFILSVFEEDATRTPIDYVPIEPGYYEVKASYSDGDASASASIGFEILRKTSTIEITSDISKAYDGDPVGVPAYTTTNEEATSATYYYTSLPDITWTTTAPSAVGSYMVKVVVPQTDHYLEEYAEQGFTISEAPSMMQVDVNPSVELVVNNAGAVVSINAENNDGYIVKAELEAKGAIGTTYEEALTIMIGVLKDKGYLADNDPISIKTQKEEYNSYIESTLPSKLSAEGITSTLTVESYTQDEIKAKALACLKEYTEAELAEMDINVLATKVINVKAEAEDLGNDALKDLFYVVRAKELFVGRLEILAEVFASDAQYATIAASLNVSISSLNTAFDAIETTYAATYFDEFSAYNVALKQLADAKEAILKFKTMSGIDADFISGLETLYTNYETTLTSLENSRAEVMSNLVTQINDASSAIDTQVTLLETLLKAKGIDMKARLAQIEQAAIEEFNEKYEDYKDLNVYTQSGITFEGSAIYYGYSSTLDTTYAVSQTTVGGIPYNVLYEFDGEVSADNLATAEVKAYYFGGEESGSFIGMAGYVPAIALTIDGTTLIPNIIDGTILYCGQVVYSETPFTIALVNNGTDYKAYFYMGNYTQAELETACAMEINDFTIESETTISTSIGGTNVVITVNASGEIESITNA